MEEKAAVELNMTQTSDLPASLPALVAQRAAAGPAKAILRRKARGIWQTATWSQLAEQVQRIGSGLHALGLGRDDAAITLAETRPETAYADIAVQSCGAASVIVHSDTEATRVEQILRATGSRIAFVENEEQLDKILSVRERCPTLTRIIIFDMKGLRELNDPHCVSLAQFVSEHHGYDWAEAARSVSGDCRALVLFAKDDPAPAGQLLLQRDVMRMIAEVRSRLVLTPHDERLALLSMADPVERIWGLYAAFDSGCISNYLEGPDTAIENLQELQPTVLGADAEVWAHLHARTVQAAGGATAVQRLLYDWATGSVRRGGWGSWAADRLVLRAVRNELGLRRVRLAYTGGRAVSPSALDWARCLGIHIRRIEGSDAVEDQRDEPGDPVMQRAHA